MHCIVPGGGLAPDGQRWVACRPGFFLPVRVLSSLFRRLFLEDLGQAFQAGELTLRGALADLNKADCFAGLLCAARSIDWVVYAKPPFGGPKHVLEYLGRYTHRVAIANSRLTRIDNDTVSFRWKDYRHHDRQKISGGVCWHRDKAVRSAPVSKMRPIRLVGAQGSRGRGLLRQGLSRREGRLTRWRRHQDGGYGRRYRDRQNRGTVWPFLDVRTTMLNETF